MSRPLAIIHEYVQDTGGQTWQEAAGWRDHPETWYAPDEARVEALNAKGFDVMLIRDLERQTPAPPKDIIHFEVYSEQSPTAQWPATTKHFAKVKQLGPGNRVAQYLGYLGKRDNLFANRWSPITPDAAGFTKLWGGQLDKFVSAGCSTFMFDASAATTVDWMGGPAGSDPNRWRWLFMDGHRRECLRRGCVFYAEAHVESPHGPFPDELCADVPQVFMHDHLIDRMKLAQNAGHLSRWGSYQANADNPNICWLEMSKKTQAQVFPPAGQPKPAKVTLPYDEMALIQRYTKAVFCSLKLWGFTPEQQHAHDLEVARFNVGMFA